MVARFTGKAAFALLILAASFLALTPAMAAVSAHLDRQVIGEGETVTLTIDINGDSSGEPDTAPLQRDFEILSRNHSSSYSLVNGSVHSNVNWQLILRPRHSGQMTIPPLKVGQASTQAIALQVKKLAARTSPGGEPSGDVWLDMQIEPKSVLVQQQAIISIKIYQATTLAQAQLTEPTAAHAVIERLGEDKQYQVTKSGRNWLVTERQYAVFPQQSGTLAISSVQLDASVLVNTQSFGTPFFQSSRPIRARSNELKLQVNPIPAAWHGANWLPASGLSLTEKWPSANSFKVGEPITRTITVQAQGQSMSQLPALPALLPDQLKSYPDQPVLKDDKSEQGIAGLRRQKNAIIPTAPGTYILPAIEIPWWNVNSGKMETAELPARTFKVTGAVASVQKSAPPAPMAATPSQLPQAVAVADNNSMDHTPWRWIAIISLCGWGLTLLILLVNRLRKKQRTGQADDAQSYDRENLNASIRAVRDACKQNDAKACEKALIAFAGCRWPDGGLGALRQHGGELLVRRISEMEHYLYAPAGSQWHGEELLHAFEQADIHHRAGKAGKSGKRLPGLYPDQQQ